MLVILVLMLLDPGVHSSHLSDVTDKAFGNYSGVIPAAFGDFNGDKLTDIVVFKSNPNDNIITVRILVANEEKVVSSASSRDPLFNWGTDEQHVHCNFPKGALTSAAPGDFDGDGGMDLLVTYTLSGDLWGTILWGHHKDDVHHLLCPEDQLTDWIVKFPLENEPLVFDYNYDYISDLFVVTSDGNRTVYVFGDDRSGKFEQVTIKSDRKEKLKAQHSNAHFDLDEDGLPDLLLTTQTGIEMYRRVGSKHVDNFEFHGHVPWPSEISENSCPVDQCVGQIVFADFDLSGRMDLAVPMCFDTLCKSSNMFLIEVSDLWTADAWTWVPMTLDLGSRHFFPPSVQSNPLQLLAPRVGDVDLDGYPDLLIPLQSSTDKPETHLLLNVHCDDCRPFDREFQIRPEYMEGTGNAILGTFFDLSEDGRTDVLTVSGDKGSGFKTSAFTNDDDNDAYFVKVVVLSGACYHNCKNKSSSFVPYGTNSGGQMIYYKSQRTGPESFHSYRSCAAQLPQSAYFSLQTPYTIFGLGNSPNFLDNLWVTVSGQSHSWPQIIPNSQMYVIPYPPGDPRHWNIKISLFPSKNILMVGLALVGVCGVLVLLILLLHVRERRQDLQAKLQESNRFHFDAM